MTDNLHTLLGPYALDAVSPEEHEAFEQHLHTCAACREELEGLQATAARLGAAAAAAPSAELRDRVMDAIARTPQERPRVATVMPGPWRRWAPRMAAAAAVLAVVTSLGAFLVERGRVQDLTSQHAAVSGGGAGATTTVRALQARSRFSIRASQSPPCRLVVSVNPNTIARSLSVSVVSSFAPLGRRR
jgi:anti-sigma factor RsiW